MNWKNSVLFNSVIVLLVSCGPNEFSQEKPEELSYASTTQLIEAEELLARSGSSSGLVLIDFRKREEYEQGHISSALNVWRDRITDTNYNYGGMMPTQHQLEQLLEELGIEADDTVVIYDQVAECDAARFWWILKFYGHRNVKLLNGGLKAWVSANGPLSVDVPIHSPSEYRFSSQPDSNLYAFHTLVSSSIGKDSLILLDTRSKEEFNGKLKDGAAKGGRIESAINLDWSMAVDYDGTHKFLDADQLKANYEAVGINGQKPVITYCHSGVRSAHTLFVLTELLGYRNIRNYDGSWTEWSHLHAK